VRNPADALFAMSSNPAPLSWYAVWTRSRAEKAVHDQLGVKGFEVFLPTVTRWSRWKDRRKRVDWPLFPGYCFARFDPLQSLQVLNCSGVATIVSFDGKPAAVPDAEVDAVRRLVTSGLQYDPCPFLKEGSRVEVVSGPLRGVVGLLVKKGPNARLVLSVDLISSAVAVTVDASDVRAY
jgi:transcriptional antiterminator NusG